MIEYILNPQSIEALGWTLLHSVWQGAVFAILLVLLLIALRSYTAQSRYVVAVGLLCAFFLTVSGTFWQQWQKANDSIEIAAATIQSQPTDDAFILNKSGEKILLSEGESAVPLNLEKLESEKSSWLLTFKNYYDSHLPLLVTIWFLGILFLQLRFLGQLAYVQRLKHYGTQLVPEAWSDKIEELEGKLRIQKKVQYLSSVRIESPMVIGWLKPVVLMPRQLISSLSETEIYAVLAHELAHIRREDFIVNLIQTFLCNVFFFHPGIWWMSNRIDDEREHCCDDLAVAATGQATSYAKTLINVSELQLRMQENTPLAMALSGKRKRGGFSSRIRRLFMGSNAAGSFREGIATACILIAALLLGLVATGRTTQDTEALLSSKMEIDNIDISSKNEPAINNILQDINNGKSTKEQKEEFPIAELSQSTDLSELPIAAPAKPPAPPKPISPINSSDSRIDALVMACADGDFELVKTLISAGIDVNDIGSEGFTPLMMATNNDETQIVSYLLNHGADVNKSYNGWTALIEAADEGSLESMKHLLKAGAKVNYYGNLGSPTAITMAASEGHLKCLQLLLEYGADINGIGDSEPPIHVAAEEDKRTILDYLISLKADVNKRNALGRTAVMFAISEGHGFAVLKLVEAGADITIADLSGATAKDYAEDADILEYLGKEKRPAIHQATLDGLIEKVQRMVEDGADVNTTDDYGRTPLHLASAENHNIDMRVLINLGADINAQDDQGRTPLMYAAADGKRGAAVLLVSEQANFNIKDNDGMTAYDWSRSGGNSDLENFLRLITENKTQKFKNKQQKSNQKEREESLQKQIEKSVEKEVKKEVQKQIEKKETFHISDDGSHLRQFNIEEKTPAFLEAARKGSVDDCNNFLNNNMSVNTTDDTGQSVLMVAASANRMDIAEFLIAKGADVNLSSTSGLTALHYAALENHDQMARLLLKNKAKVDATMRYSSTDGNFSDQPLVHEYIGATPLLIAVESQNIEVLSVLINAGADKNHRLSRIEYRLDENRANYLSASEVMGIDKDFLKESKIVISDNKWTPYRQALLLNEPSILSLFPK